jgi:6,7-dimethyl-8-ribityllumazine synthase
MTERPEDAEDWPLRDWSQRLRPPAGTEPAPATEPEILYEDISEPEEEEEAPPDEEVAEEVPQAAVVEEEVVADEVAPADEEESEAEPEPEPDPDLALPEEHAEGEFRIPDGYAVLEGAPTGHRRSVAIVVSRFNGEITQRLLDSALAELDEAGVAQEAVLVMPVPGAFELPIAAMALAKTRRYSCVIALGCVIRGETPHFDFVASEAASGLQLAGIETGVPVSFGLLTTETAEQAEARVGKGAEAARTALEMADAFAQLRTTLAAARGQ